MVSVNNIVYSLFTKNRDKNMNYIPNKMIIMSTLTPIYFIILF